MIQLSEQKRVAVEMDKQIDSIIRSSFPDLMRICAEARTVRAGGLVLGANEMTFRQLFDDLAKFVLKSSGAKDVAFVYAFQFLIFMVNHSLLAYVIQQGRSPAILHSWRG